MSGRSLIVYARLSVDTVHDPASHGSTRSVLRLMRTIAACVSRATASWNASVEPANDPPGRTAGPGASAGPGPPGADAAPRAASAAGPVADGGCGVADVIHQITNIATPTSAAIAKA